MSATHEAMHSNLPSPQKPLSEVYSLAYITKLAIACRIYHDISDVESQKTEIKEMHQHLLFLFRDIFLCPEGVTASKTILSTYLHILLPVYLDWINTAMYKHKDLDAARDYIGHATELYTVLLENGSNKNEWLPADFANTCAQFLKDTQQLFSQLNEKIKNKSLEAGIFPPYVDTDKGTYALIHLTRYAIHRKNFDEAKSYLEDAKKISCSIRNELVKQGYQTILFELSTKLTEQIQYEPIYSLVSHSKKAISDKNLEAAKEYLNAAAKVLSKTSQKDIQEYYSKEIKRLFLAISEPPIYAKISAKILGIKDAIGIKDFTSAQSQLEEAKVLCAEIQDLGHQYDYRMSLENLHRSILDKHKIPNTLVSSIDIPGSDSSADEPSYDILEPEHSPTILPLNKQDLYNQISDIEFSLKEISVYRPAINSPEGVYKQFLVHRLENMRLLLDTHLQNEIEETQLAIATIDSGNPDPFYRESLEWKLSRLHAEATENRHHRMATLEFVIKELADESVMDSCDVLYKKFLTSRLLQLKQEEACSKLEAIKQLIEHNINNPTVDFEAIISFFEEASLLFSQTQNPEEAIVNSFNALWLELGNKIGRAISDKIKAIQQALCDGLFDFKAIMLQLENAKLLCKHIHGSEKKESYELVLKKLEDQINPKKPEFEPRETNIFRSLLSRSSQGNQPSLQNNASTLSSFFKKPKSNSHDLPNSSKQNANRH